MTVGKFCKIDGEEVELCNGMSEVLESEGRGTKYQGVKIMTLVNMNTMNFSRHLIVVKSGKHAKKGLVFNFCPFCRSELVAGSEEEWTSGRDALAADPVTPSVSSQNYRSEP